MKPTLSVLLGYVFVLVPFWAQYAGIQFPPLVFALSYLCGLAVWAAGYYQMIRYGTSAELNLLFVLGLALFATMPPHISKDIYVYLLEGKLALNGHLSYTDGAANLLDPFYVFIDPHWLDCPNQYGPVALFFFKAIAWIGGENVFLGILSMKLIDIVWSVGIFFTVKYIAKATQLNAVRAQVLICLNPVFFIQGLGQMHIDLLSCVLVCGFLYAIAQNRLILAGIMTGLMGATKVMLFPLFWGLLLVYAVYSWHQKTLNFKKLVWSVLYSIVVFGLAYWPVWQGLDTIRIPMAYHENKEPVKSVVELLSYLLAYVWPQTGPDFGALDPFLNDKIYWGHQLKPVFQILALLIAARLISSVVYAKNISQLFYGFCRIMLLVFILYSPVVHAWYFLIVLPFFAVSEHRREVIWFAVISFTLANTYEIGLTVGTKVGSLIMILFTVISVLSYFLFFRKFYFESYKTRNLSPLAEVDFVALKGDR